MFFGDGPVQSRMASQLSEAWAASLYEAARTKVISDREIPSSTYRVQFNSGFGFKDAEELVGYWEKLGISHLYASPYLKAVPGSTHGYDCVDHTQLNPEVGTEVDHHALCEALTARGLGQVLDVVPNHMGIDRDNPLWWDVLENGPASLYGQYFDIDWDPVMEELKDKVLLPILGNQYGKVLERGELKLAFEEGAFQVRYYDHAFPIAPRSYRKILSLRLDELQKELGPEDRRVVELLSIITSLEHLPSKTETDRAKRLERNREKEVVKRRLAALCGESPEVLSFIHKNLEIYNGKPGEPQSFDRLHDLLEGGNFRLAHWRVAGEEINYRRFFDINGLAAIRVEDPEVFQEAHDLVFRWVAERKIHGLRIDHPDGLFDPTAYFMNLQERFFVERAKSLAREQSDSELGDAWKELEPLLRDRFRKEIHEQPGSPLRRALYVVVEKIQGGRERIPDAWAVNGTTGYRFANVVSGLFVERASEEAMTEIYEKFIGHSIDVEALVYEKKKLIMSASMSSEINVMARELNRVTEMNRRSRDFSLNSLRRALTEFVAVFPVYRTYVDGTSAEIEPRDAEYIRFAIARAKQKSPTLNTSIFDFLQDLMLRRYEGEIGEREREAMLRFVMRLQQITGPMMAKGLEDTSFYIYNRLVSLNEVGGELEQFGSTLETFHERNRERMDRWPGSLLTSSTHDTKRSEDVRARLNVLSEIPEEWRRSVRRWARLNARFKREVHGCPAPEANDEYLFYQTLLGVWPMGDRPLGEELGEIRDRVRDYMLKALREAKVNTSWVNPDSDYEEVVSQFVEGCLSEKMSGTFLSSIREMKQRIEPVGRLNALMMTVLKVSSPGTADVYQGTELWDLSLVDPDNRRPVDYGRRAELLAALDGAAAQDRAALCKELLDTAQDGRIKLFTLSEGLRLRRRRPELFRTAKYIPLRTDGLAEKHMVAFGLEREQPGRETERLVVVVPRLMTRLVAGSGGIAAALQGCNVWLPDSFADVPLREIYTRRELRVARTEKGVGVSLESLLSKWPVAVLEGGPRE